MQYAITLTLIALSFALAAFVGLRAGISRTREGRILSFVALLVLPVVAVWGGYTEHEERASTTEFCLQCHVMADFGKTLHYDDKSYIPAVHFENRFVPRDQACFTCHADYALFGGITSKIHGLKNVYVQYFGTPRKPADIKISSPFPNSTCLHCHLGSRAFETVNGHHKTADMLQKVKASQLSCTSSSCHDTIHEVGDLKDAKFWTEPK